MKVARNRLKGKIIVGNFSNNYVGILDEFGPVLLATNKNYIFKSLTKENPGYVAKNKYENLCSDERFKILNEEIKKDNIRKGFKDNLNSYETEEDINNYLNLNDPNHLSNGASEQAKQIEKGKRLSLNNGIFTPKVMESEKANDYVA